MSLNPKQQRFVEEYLVDLNGTQAAIRAGYAERAAQEQASRLLSNVMVQEAISAGRALLTEKADVDAQAVLKEYLAIGFSDIGDVFDLSGDEPKLRPAKDIPQVARRAIASVKVKRYWEGSGEDAREVEVTEFRFWPKTAALDALAKHLDLFGERKPKPIQVDVTSNGKPIDRSGLNAADLVAIAGFIAGSSQGMGAGLPADGSVQSLDQGNPSQQATPISQSEPGP